MPTVVEVTERDAPAVHRLYGDHPGWADRDRAAVRRALSNTDLGVGLRDGDRLVAAARVMTDFTFYAKVYDVVVARDRRGEGLGRELMAAVADHEALGSMAEPRLELVCREGLVPFYERCGFEIFDTTVEVEGRREAYVKMNYAGDPGGGPG